MSSKSTRRTTSERAAALLAEEERRERRRQFTVVGAVVGSVMLAVQGRDRATPIPFGPYLAIAGWIVFFWGKDMIDAYLRFAGLA